MTMLAINWGNALIITVIGFSLVLIVLILLIGVIVAFGKIFARKSAQPQVAAAPVVESHDEEMAAVAFALHLYYDVHDEESDVLTIKREDSPYWTLSQENNVSF